MRKLKTFAISMIIAAIGLLVYCGGFYIKSYEQNLQARQSYEEIARMAGYQDKDKKPFQNEKKTKQNCLTETNKNVRKKKKRKSSDNLKHSDRADEIRESFGISWENLRKINSEVAAWITIPGADISYPVVQGMDDEYYLKHNFKKGITLVLSLAMVAGLALAMSGGANTVQAAAGTGTEPSVTAYVTKDQLMDGTFKPKMMELRIIMASWYLVRIAVALHRNGTS